MNSVILTGKVIGEADDVRQISGRCVCNFRLGIDGRSDKRVTEVTVSAWDDLARFVAQYLSVGDRVAAAGSLGHMVGKGVVVVAQQLVRLGADDLELSTESQNSCVDATKKRV